MQTFYILETLRRVEGSRKYWFVQPCIFVWNGMETDEGLIVLGQNISSI
jgi:hypothetical protein